MQLRVGRQAGLCALSTLVLGCNQLLGVGELHESKLIDAGPGASDAPPAGQAVLALDTDTYQFGTVVTGASSVEHTFMISNTGTASSGVLHAEINGTATSSFSIGTNGCTGALDAGKSCPISVRFAPAATGLVDASLRVMASPGGDLMTALSGTGLVPGALVITPDSASYGVIGVNDISQPQTLSVKNTGGADSGVIDVQLTGSDAGQFVLEPPAAGDCKDANLAANQTCAVRLHFAPTGAGSKSASVVVTSTRAGGSGTCALSGTGTATGALVVNKAGGGTGTVVSTPAGISCLNGCSTQTAQFAGLSSVTLEAKGLPGSYFQGWGGACSGSHRFCTLNIDHATQTVTANFVPNTFNLVFATSETYPASFGGLAAADASCARLASAAGLPGTYVAWLSTSAVNAKDRLGSARGWVRLDGEPFADTVTALTTSHAVLHPIQYDENGTALALNNDGAWTGTDVNGANPLTCSDWTSTSATAQGWSGEAGGGPLGWTRINPSACNQGPYRLYCFQTDRTAPITITPVTGKKIWITSNDFAPNLTVAAANNACNTQRPAGVASGVALLATTTTAPVSLVGTSTSYVRPDGVLVGTGGDLAATSSNLRPLRSGIWQHGDGTYDVTASGAWTGASSFGSFSQASTTGFDCNDWASLSSLVRGGYGIFQRASSSFWNEGSYECDTPGIAFRVYCVEP